MSHDPLIGIRKLEHLDICTGRNVEFAASAWFDNVMLKHCALPELADSDLDLSVSFMGKTLAAPLMITAITGGVEKAALINRDLAAVAEELGIGFGLGSQRPMFRDTNNAASFFVRDVAPHTLVIGNLGLQQARSTASETLSHWMEQLQLDALAIHLNPAMELFQVEGDRDFRGGYDCLQRLQQDFPGRLIVKETGCGISAAVGRRLKAIGISHLDVAGAGGTSWVKVEQFRQAAGAEPEFSPFAEWGIPTAAALLELAPLGLHLVASGGIRNGLDAAKALALKAELAGLALPVIRAHQEGGRERVRQVLSHIVAELRVAMLLTGSRTVGELRNQQPVILGNLLSWMQGSNEQGTRNGR